MGRAVCRILADTGHQVWGIDQSLPDEPLPWQCLQADITDETALRALVVLLRQAAGKLDGIIHAAGVYDLDSLVEIPEERFLRSFGVNLFGMYRVNRLFLPLLAEGGRIVIVSSELGPLRPLPFTGLYAITKGAVEKYAYSLRMELQLLNHPVIVIRPGAVDTGMISESTRCLDRFCEKTALYRLNARRFRSIVGRVEARRIPPEKVASKIKQALDSKRPRLSYSLNRSPLLALFNLLPDRAQLLAIKKVIS